MSDYSELKRLAEAAIKSGSETGERWPQDDDWFEPERYGAELEYVKAVSPAAVLALIAEVESLRSQVATLQSDANSWKSGYDEGRRMGTKTALDEREQLRKDAERYRWLRQYTVKSLAVSGALASLDRDIDAAMTKGANP